MKNIQRVATTHERMQEAMATLNKKQIDLAKATGLSHSTISRYLSGMAEPRHEATINIAAALNVSEWWLWGYDVPMTRLAEEENVSENIAIVARLRSDPHFLDVVSDLANLSTDDYNSFKTLISSCRRK